MGRLCGQRSVGKRVRMEVPRGRVRGTEFGDGPDVRAGHTRTFLENGGLYADELAETMGDGLTSVFVRARKSYATSETGSSPERSS